MPPIEAQFARRKAELLWQQQMRAAANAGDGPLQQGSVHRAVDEKAADHRAVDEKTARLRSLRLAKEAVQRKTAMSAKPARR
jgi:hypothetical protein